MDNPLAVTVFFQRYEQKYLLDAVQYHEVVRVLDGFVSGSEYGPGTVYSIYYDNDAFGIARNSPRKSVYKEKLRLRSYGIPQPGDTVYLELKKKLKGVTYKERLPVLFTGMEQRLNFRPDNYPRNYIFNEMDWFLHYYKPFPQFMVCYDRRSFRGRDDKTLRITFDTNIRWRASGLDFSLGTYGSPLIGENEWIMEVKVANSIPPYLADNFNRLNLFPFSFSKYRTAYESLMNERMVHNA